MSVINSNEEIKLPLPHKIREIASKEVMKSWQSFKCRPLAWESEMALYKDPGDPDLVFVLSLCIPSNHCLTH